MTGIVSGSVTKDLVRAVGIPQHHPPQENLVDYVSGRGGNGWALVIDAHLALCAECRAEVSRLRALGGALLEDLPVEELPEGMEERVLDLLDSAEITSFPSSTGKNLQDLPRPVAELLPDNLKETDWCVTDSQGPASLGLPVQSVRLVLLRISAGEAAFSVQQHYPSGNLLVLSGGLESDQENLLAGDLKPLSEITGDFRAADTTALTFCLLLLSQENSEYPT